MTARKLAAKAIMTSPVITVRHDMSVEQVANLFSDKMISGAPVLDDDGKPIGVITSADIIRNESRREYIVSEKVSSDYVIKDWQDDFDAEELRGYHLEEGETLLARAVMTPFVYRVNEDTTLEEVADIMVSGLIHRLFVTRDKEIVGIVSALDVLKAFATFGE